MCSVTATSGGSFDLGKVAIPGAFKDTAPGYIANIYNNVSQLFWKRKCFGVNILGHFNNYTVPGPAVATGWMSDIVWKDGVELRTKQGKYLGV